MNGRQNYRHFYRAVLKRNRLRLDSFLFTLKAPGCIAIIVIGLRESKRIRRVTALGSEWPQPFTVAYDLLMWKKCDFFTPIETGVCRTAGRYGRRRCVESSCRPRQSVTRLPGTGVEWLENEFGSLRLKTVGTQNDQRREWHETMDGFPYTKYSTEIVGSRDLAPVVCLRDRISWESPVVYENEPPTNDSSAGNRTDGCVVFFKRHVSICFRSIFVFETLFAPRTDKRSVHDGTALPKFAPTARKKNVC